MARKKNEEQKIVYYSDPLNDDFGGIQFKRKPVDNNFKFAHKNVIWRFFSFIVYYVFAMPAVWFYEIFLSRVKYVNKKAIRKIKQPYYLYANHTAMFHDACAPSVITFPRRNKLIASSNAISIKGVKNLVQMVGAMPVPDGLNGMPKFLKAMEWYHKKKYVITIYPEAHSWPYYTGVRPFKDSSFMYPINTNSPVVACFTAYSEPKGLFSNKRKVNKTVYLSDPIYPDLSKPKKVAQKEVRDKVYEFMLEKSKLSTYEYIKYLPISEKPDASTNNSEIAVAENNN